MASANASDTVSYAENLRAPIHTEVSSSPQSKAHKLEWDKILKGEPVEINPSVGQGFKCANNFLRPKPIHINMYIHTIPLSLSVKTCNTRAETNERRKGVRLLLLSEEQEEPQPLIHLFLWKYNPELRDCVLCAGL